MKIKFIITQIIIALFIMLCISMTYKTSTPEIYAKNLIKILRTEDVEKFKVFYPTCEEVKSNISESITDSTKKARFIKDFTYEKCNNELNKNYSRFKDVIETGKNLGIIWKKIKYDTVEYDIKTGDYGMLSIYMTKIIFTHNKLKYYIEVKGLGKFRNGWNGGKIYGPRLINKMKI